MIRAFQGEFGLKIRYHVPRVYAMGEVDCVEIEKGEEALYPRAKRWKIIERAADDTRRQRPRLQGPEKRFVPNPHMHQHVGRVDVVICPRWRSYGSAKNWPHWKWLGQKLESMGYGVFAGGAPDSSAEVDCRAAWNYPRFLDATIEAMLEADLVVATDAGLAHLAVLCGRPLLLITHHGLVAPGPVVDAEGREMQAQYWPVRMDEYYHAANHRNAPIRTTGAWLFRKLILKHVVDALTTEKLTHV